MSKKMFIGVSEKARRVNDIYIGVGDKAHTVKKIYVGDASGKARLAYSNEIECIEVALVDCAFYKLPSYGGSGADKIAGGKAIFDTWGSFSTTSNSFTFSCDVTRYDGSYVCMYVYPKFYVRLKNGKRIPAGTYASQKGVSMSLYAQITRSSGHYAFASIGTDLSIRYDGLSPSAGTADIATNSRSTTRVDGTGQYTFTFSSGRIGGVSYPIEVTDYRP